MRVRRRSGRVVALETRLAMLTITSSALRAPELPFAAQHREAMASRRAGASGPLEFVDDGNSALHVAEEPNSDALEVSEKLLTGALQHHDYSAQAAPMVATGNAAPVRFQLAAPGAVGPMDVVIEGVLVGRATASSPTGVWQRQQRYVPSAAPAADEATPPTPAPTQAPMPAPATAVPFGYPSGRGRLSDAFPVVGIQAAAQHLPSPIRAEQQLRAVSVVIDDPATDRREHQVAEKERLREERDEAIVAVREMLQTEDWAAEIAPEASQESPLPLPLPETTETAAPPPERIAEVQREHDEVESFTAQVSEEIRRDRAVVLDAQANVQERSAWALLG